MKPKKLEKRVQFIFKKTNMVKLTKEQMKGVNGGNDYASPTDHSGNPECGGQTLNNTFQ